MDWQGLLEFASARQAQIIEAIIACGGNKSEAADALGVSRGTVRSAIERVERKAASSGIAPDYGLTRRVPGGFGVKRVSQLLDEEGNIKQQWVIAEKERENLLEAVKEVVAGLCEDIEPAAPIVPPAGTNADLLVAYPIGDMHVGQYSWQAETGTDFDLKIAERLLLGAMSRLVDCAPPAEKALVANVGDFFHGDDSSNRTKRSGNQLDVDTRWPKVLRTGARVMRQLIDLALQKHQHVTVINEIGNHDEHTSVALSLILDAFYQNEPRVEIDLSPARFHYHRHGQALIGVTHGDTVKPAQLPLHMAAQRPDDWGATQFRYWYTGHIHHQTVHEYSGVLVESFRTLAGRDSWTASMGYLSGRDMKCIVIHDKFGEIERHRVDVTALNG